MYCGKCGFKQNEDMLFCPKCGNKSNAEGKNIAIETEPQKYAVPAGRNENNGASGKQNHLEFNQDSSDYGRIGSLDEVTIEGKDRPSYTHKSEVKNNKEKVEIKAEIMQEIKPDSIILRAIKTLYLIAAIFLLFVNVIGKPEVSVSGSDILIYRVGLFSLLFFIFVFPGILLLVPSIRSIVPLFNKRKFLYTLVGWLLSIAIGLVAFTVVNSFYSDEYNTAIANNSQQPADNNSELGKNTNGEGTTEPSGNADGVKSPEPAKPVETEEPINVTEKYVSILMSGTTLNEPEAKDVLSKLNSVGINSITDCYIASGSGVDKLQSFIVLTEEYPEEKIMLTIDKRKTGYIGVRGIDLYYFNKGGIIQQISDAI